ncbi:MAG: hypothetical protein QOF61_1059 [Acidobacteriota bacterium]|nr:hypothetical protein [Acidobacteriota bacterium]
MSDDEMSEEKPIFKVTDRRLFNPDGTPRDIEREEAADATATPVERAPTSPAAEAQTPTPTAESSPQQRPTTSAGADATDAARSQRDDAGQAGAEVDPTPFANLVMFIASPAAAAMGMTEHPGMPPGEVDLPLARHCIDLLATIREKTRGNLGAQEEQILESILAELRMQYVSLTSARTPPAPARGFTGGDITGGR